jgi:hypothetical protein
MILLNSEKQCICMYGGRRMRREVAAAAEEEEEEEGGGVEEGGGGGGGGVSLGVIMTNTEIFHIFHIISLFNLPFFHIFPYHFTIQPTFLP